MIGVTDGELLAAVTGLGELREPAPQAESVVDTALRPEEQPDLRGDRDVDENAPHPWRAP